MNLIVEEINRSRKVLQRYRFKAQIKITIGRALDNDIILSEPHVSPYHMELILNENGQWQIHDLDSCNGVRSQSRKKIADGSIIESGDTLLLGRSYISIWNEQHPVEKAWPLHSVEDVFHTISSPWILMSLIGVFLFAEWQFSVMNNYRDLATSKLVNELVYEMLIILGWASVWSLGGRVLRHESRFNSQLAVTLCAAMLLQWLPMLMKILAYNGQYGLWLTEIRYFINGAIFSILLWSNFYLSLPQKPGIRIIWSNTLAWGVVLIYLLPPIFDAQRFRGYPLYDSLLLPPSVFWAEPKSPEAFQNRALKLYGRQKQPAESDNATEQADSTETTDKS